MSIDMKRVLIILFSALFIAFVFPVLFPIILGNQTCESNNTVSHAVLGILTLINAAFIWWLIYKVFA